MLLQKNFPPDIRVEKEAQSLIAAGYRVFLLCKNSKGLSDETIDGLHIRRQRRITSLALFNRFINFPLFLNPFWLFTVRRLIKKENINIVHAHDLPMAPLALLAAGRKVQVIYDMHENYPAALEAWQRKDWLSRTLKNPLLAQFLDNFVSRKVDHILVVVEEFKQELINRGLPEEKITVVGNRVDTQTFLQLPIKQEIVEKYENDFTMLYAGSFARDRGLDVPIRALKPLKNRIPNIRLLLVGDGPNKDELQQMIANEGIGHLVEFTGWRPFAEMPSYMKAADVCLIPQPSNAFINTTIPHKLFQYAALRRPMIVSDAKPLARNVEKFNMGEIFCSQRVESFVQAIEKIHFQMNAYYSEDIESMLIAIDWSIDAKKLTSSYSNLSSSRKETE